MPDFGLLRVFARELLGTRSLKRSHQFIAEISAEHQIDAMADGGKVSGRTAAGYLFHSAQICGTFRDCRTVVDLGCGTGVQLLQVAELNPHVHFVGVDHSLVMLNEAAGQAARNKVGNVSFLFGDITDLHAIAPASVDGVVSTMALHHLTDLSAVSCCFREISRILKPGGSVYIEDFGRLKSERSLSYFCSRGNADDSDRFSEMYRASMRAAFLADDLRACAGSSLPASVRTFSTFPVPFLVIVKTPSSDLTASQSGELAVHLNSLDPSQRKDYQDLAMAFRLGGLELGFSHS